MSGNLMALVWSYLYVGAVVAAGEIARRLGLSREVSRKIIHVGVGLWIFGTLALFTSPWLAAIPPLTSAAGNWVIHRKRLLKATEDAPENLGTVWFPISFGILVLVAWGRPAAIAGGLMAMTIGDALASLVGIRWGRHGYAAPGDARKSLEGSLAMFGGTFVAVLVTLKGLPALLGPEVTPAWFANGQHLAALVGLPALTAVVATCAEALGVKGRDNLWVPLSAGAVLYVALGLSPEVIATLGLGAVLAAVIGVAAWFKGSLSPSGVLGAILTGTLVFGLGGWAGGVALVGFFVSSSLLSRLFRSRKAGVEADYAKTGTRDFGQTLANGGVAAALALALGATGDIRYLGALVGALAAANADTWATELGVLSRVPPRLITTFRPATAGTSGAISLVGTLASAGGALFVGLVAAPFAPRLWPSLLWLTLAGLAGSLLDSLLGATAQAVYWCPACGKETERRVHRCGAQTVRHRGFTWLGNDLVNLAATVVGAVIGFFCVS
jgi:uncharacterized protein (TIGR00297 family)